MPEPPSRPGLHAQRSLSEIYRDQGILIRDGIDDHAMGNWRSGGPEWGMVRTYELGAAAPPGTALVRVESLLCIA